MKKQLLRVTTLVVALLALCAVSFGQGTAGSIAGTVTDPKGALVAGATVVIKNDATGQEFTATTNSEGYFRVPAVNSGVYTATITAPGFKKAVVSKIKVDVGLPSSITVPMEIGAETQQIDIVGGGELLKTENATVGTTLTGRQITDIPTASRDALDLVLTMPGTQTPGRPRSSTVNGLPRGALNISIDGINVQDNLGRSNDGFFTYVRPRTDAIDEVTVSTATPGAESSGEGAVQIKFSTKGGGNEYHGGLYWYHRNPALNANYWFFNRDNPRDANGKAQQQRILLNQPGGKIGGPISIPGLFSGKDKAFFFVNYEEYRLPETQPRSRTVFLPSVLNGTFRYGTNGANSVNLYDIARNAAFDCDLNTMGTQVCPDTPDPTVLGLLNQINGTFSQGNLRPITNADGSVSDFNRQTFSFVNVGSQIRRFPTVRFDFNLTKDHHLENIWNYQQFIGLVDFLNSADPAYPGFPNFRDQNSNRFSNSTAWRWTISNTIINEARFGLMGGTTLFGSNTNAGQFENQGGYNLAINTAISSATASNAPSRRNTPVWQFADNLTWSKGSHSFSFGANYTRINFWQYSSVQLVPNVSFALVNTDPVLNGNNGAGNPQGLFTSATMPNSSTADRTLAGTIYAILTGRISAVTASAIPDESSNFKTLGPRIQRARQQEYGFYVQDTWRVRPNITLNYGLRWEIQQPYEALNGTFSQTTYAGLFGVSGEGNIFKPGTQTGTPTVFTPFTVGDKTYDTDYGNFAPSFGFTYSPNFSGGILHKLFGNSGQTVFRGGFSMAFVREGINTLLSINGANPGGGAGQDASLNTTNGRLAIGSLLRTQRYNPVDITGQVVYPFISGPPPPPANPTSGRVAISAGANTFAPNLKTGYAESWSFGVQREITSDMVVEARYVGTRGHKLWRQYNLNEVNALENGFAAEFALAQQNLLSNIACQNANVAVPGSCTGGGLHFRYRGPGTGTSPLPIFLGNFTGIGPAGAGTVANYTNANFANTTLVNALNPLAANVLTAAAFMGTNQTNNGFAAGTFRNNRVAAGFALNQFVVNPDLLGGSFIVDNGGQTWYDAFTFELRRRMSKGLLVQASYSFSKSIANSQGSDGANFTQYPTLRNPNSSKALSAYDLTHAFKTNFIYELPVGKGKALFGDANGWVDRIVGGWGFNGAVRVQSGTPFYFGHVQLIGMTREELQSAINIRKEGSAVFYLPQDIVDNTRRAFNPTIISNGTGANQTFTIAYLAPTGLTGNTAPTGRFIAPASYGNCQEAVSGQCGFDNLVVRGPMFTRADLSIVKRIRFTERVNLELRGEFLNAFNNINFRIGSAANDTTSAQPALGQNATFGQTGSAYQDISTTNDPGGRMVQIVIRINF